MDNITNQPADEWAVPDDAGFEEIKARFRKNREKKRRRTLLALLLLSVLAWTPIVASQTLNASRRGDLAFERDRLDNIIAQIEHSYDIHVSINDEQLKHLQFSGTFRQEKPEKILDVLSRSLKFTWTQSGVREYVIERR